MGGKISAKPGLIALAAAAALGAFAVISPTTPAEARSLFASSNGCDVRVPERGFPPGIGFGRNKSSEANDGRLTAYERACSNAAVNARTPEQRVRANIALAWARVSLANFPGAYRAASEAVTEMDKLAELSDKRQYEALNASGAYGAALSWMAFASFQAKESPRVYGDLVDRVLSPTGGVRVNSVDKARARLVSSQLPNLSLKDRFDRLAQAENEAGGDLALRGEISAARSALSNTGVRLTERELKDRIAVLEGQSGTQLAIARLRVQLAAELIDGQQRTEQLEEADRAFARSCIGSSCANSNYLSSDDAALRARSRVDLWELTGGQLGNLLADAEALYRNANASSNPAVKADVAAGQGRILLARKRAPEAITRMRNAVEAGLRSPSLHYWLAQAYVADNRMDKAYEQALAAAQLLPQLGEEPTIAERRERTLVNKLLAEVSVAQGDYNIAPEFSYLAYPGLNQFGVNRRGEPVNGARPPISDVAVIVELNILMSNIQRVRNHTQGLKESLDRAQEAVAVAKSVTPAQGNLETAVLLRFAAQEELCFSLMRSAFVDSSLWGRTEPPGATKACFDLRALASAASAQSTSESTRANLLRRANYAYGFHELALGVRATSNSLDGRGHFESADDYFGRAASPTQANRRDSTQVRALYGQGIAKRCRARFGYITKVEDTGLRPEPTDANIMERRGIEAIAQAKADDIRVSELFDLWALQNGSDGCPP